MGTIYYETAPMPQTDGTNIVVNGDGKLDLGTDVTTKLLTIDNKVDKPTGIAQGKVATADGKGGVTWEDVQGGGSKYVIVARAVGVDGQTATATKGSNVKTATISNGVAKISVDEGGVWSVSTSNRITQSTENMVYYGEYEIYLPADGSTITPINDIPTWLQCGGLIKDYTTLAQVCADTTTLVSLMNNENANKYLVRSTNFATTLCGNKNFADQLALVKYNNLFDNLTSNATWYNAIIASAYFTTICPLLNNVAHTSETSTVGTASETGHKEDFPFWHALKLLSDTMGNRAIWYAEKGHTGTYTFNKKCKVLRFEYENSVDGSMYYGNVDIYSNDDNVKIASNTGVAENNKKYTINIAKDKLSYNSAYKFVATAVMNGLTFSNLRMYGRYIN